jgi:hypothetical protein
MGASRPLIGGRRGAGYLPPTERAGGSKNISRPLPRVFSRIKKFLIREEVPEAGSAVSSDGALTHPYHYEYAVSDGALS